MAGRHTRRLNGERLECADYPLYSQTLRRLGAEAITDPPSPTNLLGDWYANLIFVGHTPLVICVSERSLLPVLVEVKGASSFHPRFLEAARSVLQGIGAERDTVRRVREIGSFAIGMTASRRTGRAQRLGVARSLRH